ncbi:MULTISPECIES: DUF2523 family protein [Acinetobacter]|uniref:DUF2523 domain-containing protein n=1 Tax=Acinetobacter soli NIPH 2899 TaxID=1217677 RepID=A0ABN0JXB8_9GAMM|nr:MULTISPECIES: DUF2523 family protein [Acinetobacter]ENV60175.1 hypothetical protein F950_02737 [Acinetobacter soli NIPH 2899]KOR14525.1 hypothetical protein ABW55_13215 [Acinetobacter sp. C15]WEH87863.1 DUF2523 family protein [Acinetobacter soli]WEH87873.1 DUF2523 family protein [Acinetobacter soli]WEI11436.1 DUF2523 family protein [Acinetobacter soli]
MAKLLTFILTSLVSSLIARLLLGAGLSIVTYKFINDLVDQAKLAIGSALHSLPSDVLSFIQLLKIDLCLSILMSAIAIAAYIKSAKIFIGKS